MAKKTRITTPVGQAVYPHLNQPDTAFNQSKYSCKLVIEGEEGKGLFDELEEMYDKGLKIAQLQHGEDSIELKNKKPYGKEGDEYWFMAKQDTTSKDGKYQFSIALVDSRGNPTKAQVGSGSRLRLSIEPATYLVGGRSYGLTLRLRAAQIIELRDQGTSEFDVVDGGYVAEDLSEAFEDEAMSPASAESDF